MERIVGKRWTFEVRHAKRRKKQYGFGLDWNLVIVTYRCSQLLALVTFDIRSDERSIDCPV